MRHNLIITSISLIFALTFCKKEPLKPEEPILLIPLNNDSILPDTSNIAIGMYVLNEGLMNLNNTSLTYFHYAGSISYTDYFERCNARKLGDTGNDMEIYGTKLFIVMSVSGQVEVVDAISGKSLKQIALFNGTKNRQPRRIAFCGNHAFVCSFDGSVAVIDTATLEITKYLAAGRNPDGIACVNNKIYVSNSGGLDAPKYDNSITIFDAIQLREIKKITTAINPYSLTPDGNGKLYLITRGDYGKIKMGLHVIDCVFDSIEYTFPGVEALGIAITGDTAYIYHFDFSGAAKATISMLNLKSKQTIRDNFITDATEIETPYGIAIEKNTGMVCITNARGFVNVGDVYCFKPNGKLQFSFKAGLNPGKICFVSAIKNTLH